MNFPQIQNKQFIQTAHTNQFVQNQSSTVQNYHKLLKMKKLLMDTETKMFNRIKLFQKASQKLLKKKQHQLKVYQKIQDIKKDPIFSRTRPKSRQNIAKRSYSRLGTANNNRRDHDNSKELLSPQNLRHINFDKQNLIENHNFTQNRHMKKISPFNGDKFQNNFRQSEFIELQHQSSSPHRKNLLAQRINQTRIQNAKVIKQDRQRNKIIIEQRKKKQLSRKLQSANLIRRQRQKAKIVKQQCFKEKHQDWKKFMDQKYEREKQQFMKLQAHLQQLQQKQKQALITWKKTVQN